MESNLESFVMRQFSVGDWRDYKNIRLRALKQSGHLYLTRYDEAKDRSDDFWRAQLMSEGLAVFGLYRGRELIGLTGICRWYGDESGRTACLVMSFIDAAYRGRGLSSLLYEARLSWLMNNGSFDRVRVSHRRGNEASRCANRRYGFKKIKEQVINWPDGQDDVEVSYELKL